MTRLLRAHSRRQAARDESHRCARRHGDVRLRVQWLEVRMCTDHVHIDRAQRSRTHTHNTLTHRHVDVPQVDDDETLRVCVQHDARTEWLRIVVSQNL
jgi:hypothetical protein